MSAIFPPANKGGVPPGPNVCNGLTPEHQVIGEGPLYISPDCTTVLTDCQMNALTSEILGAVDALGFPYNTTKITNLGDALRDRFEPMQADIDSRVRRSGDTMEGPLNLAGDAAEPLEAVPLRQAEQVAQAAADGCCDRMQDALGGVAAGLQEQINNRVRRDGDQMTGPLLLPSDDPTEPNQAATKAYVDASIGGILVAPEPPSGVSPNRLWWNSSTGQLFIRFDDGDSVQWVEVPPARDAAVATGDTPPTNPEPGELWWDGSSLMVWNIPQYGAGYWTPVGGGGGAQMGVTDGSDALPGEVGEYLSAQWDYAGSSPRFISQTTAVELVSLNVTPGDWNVWAVTDGSTEAAAVFDLDTGVGGLNSAISAVAGQHIVAIPQFRLSTNQPVEVTLRGRLYESGGVAIVNMARIMARRMR